MPRPPADFYGFVGQRPIVTSIRRLIEGCQSAGKTLPHTLLIGPSGCGKTHLAEAISKALGTTLHYILCGRETTRITISEKLQAVRFGDLVFMDEIHALRYSVCEFLYPAMDSRRTLAIDDSKRSPALTEQWVDIQPCTIIAASDRAGELRNAFRRRCPQVYGMETYTLPELREICANRASQMGVLLSPQATTALAGVCRGTPRNLRHMLQSLMLYFPACTKRELTKRDIAEYLKGEGIDSHGLTPRDRAYLAVLAKHSRAMSVQSIALSLGADEDFVSHELEPTLVRLGFVQIDKGGRTLTPEGIAYAGKAAR